MMTYNKILVAINLFFLALIGLFSILKLSFYNWALWMVPIYFYILTLVIIKFLEKNINDKFLPIKFAQVSVFKLIFSLGFILLFKLFLGKTDWINFIIFSGVNYIAFTVYEVKHLLGLLK